MDKIFSNKDNSVFTEKNGKKTFFGPGDVIQSCNSVETLMARVGEHGSLNTAHVLWLKSKQPIKPEDVVQSLYIVSRRVPHLQLCLEKRRGQLFFKRMLNFEIDLEISNDEVMQVLQEEVDTPFNLFKGPLWKVILVRTSTPMSPQTNDVISSLIFIACHCITDGVTNMVISREIVANLNKIVAGTLIVPEYVPIPVNIKEDTECNLPSVFKIFFKFFSHVYYSMIRNFSSKSSFGGVFPFPKINVSSTNVLSEEFSIAETATIARMCKEAGITINSFIVTMINFALLAVANSRSKNNLKSATIQMTHAVNIRRYLGPHRREDSGCLVAFLGDRVNISLSDAVEFWDVAKKTNSNVRQRLDEKEPLAAFPFLKFAWIIFSINKYLTGKGRTNKTDCHYGATNMGNLNELLPGPIQGDTVEITKLLRSVSMNYNGAPFSITFQTFRDHLSISMDYCSNKVTGEVAHQIFEMIKLNIRNMISQKCIQGLTGHALISI